MSVNTDDLRALSGERVPLPIGFEIPESVWEGVRRWPLMYRAETDLIHKVCSLCDQSVMVISTPKGAYTYSDDAQDSLVLAHLIQAHDWTREGPR